LQHNQQSGYTTTKDAADIAELARTAIDSGIPVSRGGIAKLDQYLEDLRQAVQARVQPAAQTGVTIPRTSLEQAALQGRLKYAQTLGPGPDLAKYDQQVREILKEFQQTPDIPVDAAQTKKTATYAAHPEAFGPEAAIAPEQRPGLAAIRNVTLAIKDELEKAIPELASLNPQQQKFLNLEPVLNAAVNKYLNSGGFTGRMAMAVSRGLGLGAAGALIPGLTIGHAVGGGTGLLALHGILSDPSLQSRLAIGMNLAQKANPARWGVPRMATITSRVRNYVNEGTLKYSSPNARRLLSSLAPASSRSR
jgi:hypothetical protein